MSSLISCSIIILVVCSLRKASLITLIDGLVCCTHTSIQLFLITMITIIKARSIMGNHCIVGQDG